MRLKSVSISRILKWIALFIVSYIGSILATIIAIPIMAMPIGVRNFLSESQKIPNTHYEITEVNGIYSLERIHPKGSNFAEQHFEVDGNIVEDKIMGVGHGVYYNDKYIIGFKVGYIDIKSYFIIIPKEGDGVQDDFLLLDRRSDFLAALDSLNINLREMKIKKHTYISWPSEF